MGFVLFSLFIACVNEQDKPLRSELKVDPDVNFLDSFANYLEKEEDARFEEQINDGNFFVLETIIDKDITGNVRPQASSRGETSYAFDFHNFPDSSFKRGYFKLEPQAKLTDVMSDDISATGLLISQKAKTVFESFNLGRHQFFPCSITDQGGETLVYYYLQFIPNLDPSQHINFDQSEFLLDSRAIPVDSNQIVQFNSFDAYETFKNEKHQAWLNNTDEALVQVDVKQLHLENLDTTLGIFMFSRMTDEIYVSKSLAEALKNSGVTGL